jgi:hypothetical protein
MKIGFNSSLTSPAFLDFGLNGFWTLNERTLFTPASYLF